MNNLHSILPRLDSCLRVQVFENQQVNHKEVQKTFWDVNQLTFENLLSKTFDNTKFLISFLDYEVECNFQLLPLVEGREGFLKKFSRLQKQDFLLLLLQV